MKPPAPQTALREWRAHFSQPVTLVVLVAVAGLLTITGPFGTLDYLRPAPRFVYWLIVGGATYSAGFVISALIQGRLSGRAARWAIALLVGMATALCVAGIVIFANWVTFNYLPTGPELAEFLGTVGTVALIISVILSMLTAQSPPTSAATSATVPPLLDRLPLEKRGPLVALSVEDHYVRIRTLKGEGIVLLRLADAMREVGGTAGLQVHRSHWVALSAVTAARREGDRAILTMASGPEIPVSRRYIPAIREAGLLPR